MKKIALYFVATSCLLTSCLPPVWQAYSDKGAPTWNVLQTPNLLPQPPKPADAESESAIVETRRQAYVGVRRSFRLRIPPEYQAAAAKVSSTSGQVKPDDAEIGLYHFTPDVPNILAQVTVEVANKTETKTFQEVFRVLPLPTPEIRWASQPNAAGKFSAAAIQKWTKFELESLLPSESETAKIVCDCQGFTLVRIAADGKRAEAKQGAGAWGATVTDLLKKAQTGDVFIFQNIQTTCGKNDRPRTLPSVALFVE